MDLTTNANCYVNKLVNMSPSVQDLFKNSSVSFEQMAEAVNTAVRQAKDTPARKRFLECLYLECFTKRDIETLCANAVAKGRKYTQ